jgi:hypothetical protein
MPSDPKSIIPTICSLQLRAAQWSTFACRPLVPRLSALEGGPESLQLQWLRDRTGITFVEAMWKSRGNPARKLNQGGESLKDGVLCDGVRCDSVRFLLVRTGRKAAL